MEDTERQEKYKYQTAESYRLLGQFIAEFELLIFSMRSILERDLGRGVGDQSAIQALTLELTALPLGKAFSSYAISRSKENAVANRAISTFKNDFVKLIEIRNDLVHGTHFIGWTSQEQADFSEPDLLRLKNKKSGVTSSQISISHESMAAYISQIRRLNKVAMAIGVHVLLNKWEAQFDPSGKFKFDD